MTYGDLIRLIARHRSSNEEEQFDPTYSIRHLTVVECFGVDREWSDEVGNRVLRNIQKEYPDLTYKGGRLI